MDKSYEYLYSMGNLVLAWRKARENKTRRKDVIEFEENIEKNLIELHYELKNKTYKPRPLKTFILRDPKTRVISKADFRDRVVHHILLNVIKPILEKSFFYDSCANQINKGTSFALKRFDKYKRKVTYNYSRHAFCLKADIKHYFQEVNHEILLKIIARKIKDENVTWLIKQILNANFQNVEREINIKDGVVGENLVSLQGRGMPLGNYTSQFFANLYLNELDYFVKHILKVRFYIRYVDDFVILHSSKEQLEKWKIEIDKFLRNELKLELHPQKSRIVSLLRGVDFVGFRNFYHYKLLRKRNMKKMRKKIELFREGKMFFGSLFDSYQGWRAYACWANTYKLRERIKGEIIKAVWNKID